ncbi:MAG: dehydratase [Chloroflexi bacterium]|nr:MAG: dehydratase [Chloroflexota bacterium]
MAELTRPRGRYFEEFEIGDSVETPSRTITEADVTLFAGISGDYNQLHTDVEFAKETLFGERIAHGLLVLSIASGLASRLGLIEGTTLAFTGLEWKFRAPVKFGDTLRVRLVVKQKKAMPRLGGGFVIFGVAVLNQRDESVQKGTWKVLIESAP